MSAVSPLQPFEDPEMTSATANEATPHNPFIGRVMGGRYQVDRLIGRGGMGLVYLGRELLHDRELVLKMLAPHWAEEPSAVARFEREGKRLSELRHPHIVELFDIGHEADNPYIVMEFIRGVPLRKVLNANGRLTESEFLPIAAQLLEAVAYAHGKGVMLRDIKPSNVMLCEHEGKANYVKVLDFGLAKMVDGDDVEVTKSNVIGTAGFLAPELIRGGEIDVRVDIYALSIMFFIMLTGSSPVRGENDGAILYNHVHGEPRPFAEALPEGEEVSKALQDLIYKGMAKDAADRQADAAQMLEELRGVAEPEAFELPECTPEAEKDIERYWARKFAGRGLSDKEPSSSLWTRPRLEKLLEGDADEAAEVEASDEDPYGTSPGAPLRPAPSTGGHNLVDPELDPSRAMPPQPSAAIRAKTTGRLPAAATQMGLPTFSADSIEPPLPPPGARRPKPARTVASSNMERALPGPPPRRRTLLGPQGPQDSVSASEPAANGKATQSPSMPASMLAPMPLEAPSPLEGDNDVGPLHLELQVPTGRRGAGSAAKRSTIPMGSVPGAGIDERATDELDVLELDELEIDVEDEADADAEAGQPEPELEPITDPIAPVTRPAPDLSAAPSLPLMAEAEHAPPKRGIGVVLAIAVGAALAVGGVVTWLALRSPDAPVAEEEGAAIASALDEDEPPTRAEAASEDLIVLTDDELGIDPDAPGKIRVEGPEGAEAFINDESVGAVPAEVSRGPGLYEIRVVAKGYEDWSTEVQLQPDGHAKLVATSAAKDEPEPSSKTNARRKRPSGGSRPAGGTAKPEPKPEPASEPKPAEQPEPKPEPKPEPPPKKTPPPEDEDDVFMKRGEKKDDGIFLPVGK